MNKTKPKIVFLVNVLRQARCVRRIEDFIKQGYDVHVYGYNRTGGKTDPLSYDTTLLGTISMNSSYYDRLKMMRSTIRDVVKKEGTDCLYYLFNYDVALAFLTVNRKSKYIYEISDLMELMVGNLFVKKALISINKWMMRGAKLNVFTSEGFLDYYYKKTDDRSRTIVLPNKLNKKCLSMPFPNQRDFDEHNIKFSFTGAIRSEALYKFIKTIGEYGKHEMHLYGVYTDDKVFASKIKDLVEKYSNVFYHGKFLNPDDFPNIYANVDVVVSLYTASDNDKYLEPNKLFEALFFRKPIIVADKTFLGNKVTKLNAGFIIDVNDDESYRRVIADITNISYNLKRESIEKLSPEYSIDDPKQLFEKVKEIL